jgi:hypothetical protein
MVVENIRLILVVTGLMTSGAIVFFLAPLLALKPIFGIDEATPVLRLITRHWALLVFLVGLLLVYAALEPALRTPILIVAGIEKIAFAILLFFGPVQGTFAAKFAAAGDAMLALLYVLYFLGL